MAWKKAPASLVELFASVFPNARGAQPRNMFGYPSGFVNGNMFAGVFQDSLFVRLDERGRAELLALEGAAPFEPMPGRPMRDYVVVPADMLEEADEVRRWVARALAHTASLPPKAMKVAAKAKSSAGSRAAKKPRKPPKGR